MELNDLISAFKNDFPEFIIHTSFTPPPHQCTRWVLIRGPAYGDKGFRGSLLVDASQLLGWAEKNAEGCWSTDEANQQARIFLPEWLREADVNDESVTLLDKNMHGVAKLYDQNFLAYSHTRMYCPDCNALHGEVVISSSDIHQNENLVQDEWSCPVGHIVYNQKHRGLIIC